MPDKSPEAIEARRAAIRKADHSLRLEGLEPSPLAKQLSDEVAAGRMTWAEYRQAILDAD